MRPFAPFALLAFIGCGNDTHIGPDPTGGGGSTSNMMTGGGGSGASPGGGWVSGTRIKARTLVGEDGSRSPNGVYDSELATSCYWLKANDGATRCLPEAESVGYFVDDACTQPIIVKPEGSCPPRPYAVATVGSCSDVRYRIYSTQGTTPLPSDLWTRSGENCVSTGVAASSDAYIVGAEIPRARSSPRPRRARTRATR